MRTCAKPGLWGLCACLAAGPAIAQPSGQGPFLTVQVGGGLGLVAVGGGWWGGRQRLEPELLVGYVPRALGSRPLFIFTAKATYVAPRPRLELGERAWVQPLAVGGFVNYTAGRAFFVRSVRTGRYPQGYYWWSSAVRLGACASLRVVRVREPGQGFRQVLYSEWSTNDLYAISRASNCRLRLTEIVVWGAGAKAGL
ncbi:hypothetical protein SAMN02745146_0736 [Hymenobacter daecheongensis DSM 21074]|uniref:Uncharacterized protein n=1 Tax=Hymenobacter daecheongensis DSM 21074 TaxID=1121955 RepID=A0A1M6AR61_9BACT|nr:hypothetical protein [Hymenobacter daecheongensis]SHI39009.1 hypothetical protein SAMN02745146_0736 [Hymenobacter daecheongensis DSM 21074]